MEFKDEWHDVLWRIQRSIRYHHKRMEYYDWVVVSFFVGNKALVHKNLYTQFLDVEMMWVTFEPSNENLIEIKNKILEIEKDEPPIKRVLDVICHNEMVSAGGYEEKYIHKISWWQYLMRHFINDYKDAIGR